MAVISLAWLAAIVVWNGQPTGKSNANGKAIICEPKYLMTSNAPKGLELRGYIFQSDKVILEVILQDGDRFKIGVYSAQSFYSEDNQLKWGAYNTFWQRWGGMVLDRKTLELRAVNAHDGSSFGYDCELYSARWRYRMVMRKHLKSLQAQLNKTQSQNKI